MAEKLKDKCWILKYSTDKKNEEISQIIKNSPDDFGGGSSKNPWGPTRSIIQLTENPAEKQIKQILMDVEILRHDIETLKNKLEV